MNNKQVESLTQKLLDEFEDEINVTERYILKGENQNFKIKKQVIDYTEEEKKINKYDIAVNRVWDIFTNARQLLIVLNGVFNTSKTMGLGEDDIFPINFLGHQCLELTKKSLVIWSQMEDIFNIEKKYKKKNDDTSRKIGILNHKIQKIKLPKHNLTKILKCIEEKLSGISDIYFSLRFMNSEQLSSAGKIRNKRESKIIKKFDGKDFINLINIYYMIANFIMKDYIIGFVQEDANVKTNLYDLKVKADIIVCSVGKFEFNSSCNLEELRDIIEQRSNELHGIIKKETIKKRSSEKPKKYRIKIINTSTEEFKLLAFIKNVLKESNTISAQKLKEITITKTINQKVLKAWCLCGAAKEILKLFESYEAEINSFETYMYENPCKEIVDKVVEGIKIEKINIYKNILYILEWYKEDISLNKIKCEKNTTEYITYIQYYRRKICECAIENRDIFDKNMEKDFGDIDFIPNKKLKYLNDIMNKNLNK